MTWPIARGPIVPDPAVAGCTTCGTQDTVTLSSRVGRRCAAHPDEHDLEGHSDDCE